jgi:hypothetical protein
MVILAALFGDFRLGLGSDEGQVVIALCRQLVGVLGTMMFRDTCCDSDSAIPIHEPV